MMGRLRELLHTARMPLYANANALIANQVLSAGLGYLYWVLAARLYGADVVGKSLAVISALLLISGLSQLGFGGGMTRFLPRAGHRTRRIIAMSYAAVIAASVAMSLAFVAFGGSLGLGGVLGSGPMMALWVTLAAVAWTVFRLQDAVLIGLRQSKWVLIENTIYNFGKIAVLVLGVRLLANVGIVGSYFLPIPVVIALCTWLIFVRYTNPHRIAPLAEGGEPPTVREVALSSGGDHIGSLAGEIAQRLLPVLVVATLGGAATAYFGMAWQLAVTLGLLASAMTDSFTAEAAADRPNIGRYSWHILKYMARLILPAALVLGLGAPWILLIFGKAYSADGATLLRWLCVATPFVVFNYWFIAYGRVVGQITRIVWLQILRGALLIGLTYVLLPPLGINGIGVAFLVSEAAITVAGLIDARRVLFGGAAAGSGAAAVTDGVAS